MTNVYVNKKAVREVLADIDYKGKLNASERLWLDTFVAATAGNDMQAQAIIAPTDAAFRKLYVDSYEENNARDRDIMNKNARVSNADVATVDSLLDAGSDQFEYLRCDRCQSKAADCRCPARGRNSPYGREDYTPISENEDTTVAAIDLKRRMAAYDLLPYGDNPPDLAVGHVVQICLPVHLFKNAWGRVREFRAQDGKYLVVVQSKRGLRNRDGTLPKEITIWVSPTGLRRYPPMRVSNG